MSEKKSVVIPVNEEESVKDQQVDESCEDWQAQANEYLNDLKRLQAEFNNYRNRVERENERLYHSINGNLILDFLPVLDDLERVLDHPDSDACSHEGVQLIYQKFQKLLQEKGLETLPSVGEVFDPEIHEAVGLEAVDHDKDGIIIEEWQKGYRIRERLLRPSRVKVGKYMKDGDENS